MRQHDPTDCGPAALLSVLQYWGGDAALAEIRALAGTDLSGSSLLGLQRAGEALGFRARAATGTLRELSEETLPCIAHVVLADGSPHFLVVYRISDRCVSLGDPARGRHRLPPEEFLCLWRFRSVLLLQATRSLRKDLRARWICWIASHCRAEPAWLVQSLFLGVISATLGLATALFVQRLIDRFIPERSVRMILVTGGFLLVLLAARATTTYLRQRFLLRLSARLSIRLDAEFLNRLFKLPPSFFESRALGDISARRGDGIRIQAALLELLGTSVIDGLIVVGSFVGLVVLAPSMALVASGLLPLYAAYLLTSIRPLRDRQSEVLAAHSALEATFVDHMRGIGEILAFGASESFARLNEAKGRDFQNRAEGLGVLQSRLGLASEFATGTLLVVALVWGALYVVGGTLQLGEFVAGYGLLGGLVPSVQRLTQIPRSYQEGSLSAARFHDLLHAPLPPERGRRSFRIDRSVRLEDAVLEWPSGRRILDRVNLSLKPGEAMGLVGANGAGKSSLLSVLNGMRRLSGGQLLVDEVPIDAFSHLTLRRSISVVPEEVTLFRGTLAANVLLDRDLGDPSEALRRLEQLGFCPYLDRFVDGWNTQVGEGCRSLSAGERQVVGFLRSLAAFPALLLVDEGLRSADAETKAMLLSILLRYREERVVVVVSHDPRIIERLDRVSMMLGGRIATGEPPGPSLEGRFGPPARSGSPTAGSSARAALLYDPPSVRS